MDLSPRREEPDAVLRDHPERLAAQLHAQCESLFPPDAREGMRRVPSKAAAALPGVGDGHLRGRPLERRGPSPETSPGHRRLHSAPDVPALRHLLARTARTQGDDLPGRRQDDRLRAIAIMNVGVEPVSPGRISGALRTLSRPSLIHEAAGWALANADMGRLVR